MQQRMTEREVNRRHSEAAMGLLMHHQQTRLLLSASDKSTDTAGQVIKSPAVAPSKECGCQIVTVDFLQMMEDDLANT